MADSLQYAFDNLSKMSVVFSSLSALFSVYVVLFTLAVWTTYRRKSSSYRSLRVVTILLFADLFVHYVTRGITFARFRYPDQSGNEEALWTVSLLFIGSITVTIAGLLSDGLVAWRFYVIYERRQWALWVPTVVVILNALLGFSADFQYLAGYKDPSNMNFNGLLHISFTLSSIWGWCMLGMNTLLTGGIIGKILLVARRVRAPRSLLDNRLPYAVVIEAIVESAVVNCVGLLLYELSTIAPTGHIESSFGVGYVMFCILPVFFGISQCLITVRLCMIDESHSNLPSTSRMVHTMSFGERRRSGTSSEQRASTQEVICLTPTNQKLPGTAEKSDVMDFQRDFDPYEMCKVPV